MNNIASDRILAAIVCPGEVPAWVTPTLDRTAGLWRAEVVVGAQCQTQQLTFAAAPRSGQIWLEQIALVRAP